MGLLPYKSAAAKGEARMGSAATVPRDKKPPQSHHDPLHMMDRLTNCHCMCPRCWIRTGPGTGRCVCPECPCEKRYIPLFMSAFPARLKRNG